jgi:CHASE3 domain sensor protein
MRKSLMNVPNVGFALALTMLGGIALLSYRNTQSVAEVAEVRHRGAVKLDYLQEFLLVALDIETGQRGYLVTGDPLFLEPYKAGMEQLKPQLLRLRASLADDPRQQSGLTALEMEVTQLVRHHRETVSLKANHEDESARRVVATGRGKQIMDRIRHNIAALRSEEREQLQQRDHEFQTGLRWSLFIIVAGSLTS